MKRKVIKQGHNTLTVTLPAEWAKRFNLNGGNEIDLVERDNGLFISTSRIDKEKSVEFDISEMDIPTIWKNFMAVYREGFNEIKIKFSPERGIENPYKFITLHRIDSRYKRETEKRPVYESLQGFVNRFIGMEIVEHGRDYILVREMGELTNKEFDNSLRRIFLLVQQMIEDTMDAIKTKNPRIVSRMHDVDINLDKFHDYCIRILNKVGNKETRKVSILFSTLFFLELIGDEFKHISHHLVSYSSKNFNFNHIETFAEAVKKQIEIYTSLFYKFDQEKIDELSKIDQKMYESVPEVYKKANEEEKEIFHHLRIIIRHLNSLLELRVEMEY